MEFTCLFGDLLRHEEQASLPSVHPVPDGIVFSSRMDNSLRRGAVLDTHEQAKKASNLVIKLEARCGGTRAGKQFNSAVTEQLIAEAKKEISQINLSRLKDAPQHYYSGVLSLLNQRLQTAVAKYMMRTAERSTSALPPTARMTLTNVSGSPSSINVSRAHPEGLMMEQTLYPSLTLIDHSQQASAQSVTQTLHEVQQIYKHIAATVQHDGERIFGLHETIDNSAGFMDRANGYVQKTYALSRRYHNCIVLVLLIILAWIIIRRAIRRI